MQFLLVARVYRDPIWVGSTVMYSNIYGFHCGASSLLQTIHGFRLGSMTAKTAFHIKQFIHNLTISKVLNTSRNKYKKKQKIKTVFLVIKSIRTNVITFLMSFQIYLYTQ